MVDSDGHFLGGLFSLLPILFNQILVRFSEEEFFYRGSSRFFLDLLAADGFLPVPALPPVLRLPSGPWMIVNLRLLFGASSILLVLFGLLVIKSYQASFYTPNAEAFPGISNETPFLCGTTTRPGQRPMRPLLSGLYKEKSALIPT